MKTRFTTLLNRASRLRSRLERERLSERASPLVLMRLQRLNLMVTARLKEMALHNGTGALTLQPIAFRRGTHHPLASQFAR